MELILARHGNTFNAGEPVVWVGSQNDLPLVKTGENQAKLLGQYLVKTQTTLAAVYTGPLLRMTSYAKIMLDELQSDLKPQIDLRLNEINYGKWSGLTKEEVCEKFGVDEFENWEKHSRWPQCGEWGESKQAVIARIKNFADSLVLQHDNDEKILVVGSNGSLRYFLDLIPHELQHHLEASSFKIATGNMCKLTYADEAWQVDCWNVSPGKMLAELAG